MKKVLNVIGSLNTGGAEINTMNILRNLSQTKYSYEFLVFDETPGTYEQEAENLGAVINRLPVPKANYRQFLKEFDELLKAKKYDVIHVNTLWNSGLLLRVAKKNKVPIRICHSHSTESSANENFKYRIYKRFMRHFILKYATNYIACGRDAGNYLYGKGFFEKKGQIIYNGVDLSKFCYDVVTRKKMRNQVNIPNDTFVIGHVGRMAPVKNQLFIVKLVEKMLVTNQNVHAIFIGDGPDFNGVQQYIKEKSLEKYFTLLGDRKDVAMWLQAFDIFVFPSIFEGFPVSLIEAQASKLPCLISTGVTSEAKLTEETLLLSLEDEQQWEKELLNKMKHLESRGKIDITNVENRFDIIKIVNQWEIVYALSI